MKNLLARFWKEEEGMGTVELVIIIGILVAVALIFRKQLILFVNSLMDDTFDTSNIPGPTEDVSGSTGT